MLLCLVKTQRSLVRVPNEFIKALETDGDWELTARTDGSTMKSVKARELWNKIADAAWRCVDPEFSSTQLLMSGTLLQVDNKEHQIHAPNTYF